LCEDIDDRGFMDLYWKIVKAGYVYKGTHYKGDKGTPQGSIVSPILANIYLHKLDIFIMNYKNVFDKGLVKRKNAKYRKLRRIGLYPKFLHKLKIISTDVKDNDFKRLYYIRYADDFIIGLDCNKIDALNVMDFIKHFIFNTLKMELKNEEIISFRNKITRFLGFDIRGHPY
jgi:retron-type reverse transcriptase